MPAEKIYLQFDKPAYLAGDTIWFKAYLFNASYLTPSAQTGILYVDIANGDSVVIKRYRLPVAAGVTWGNIALNKEDFKEGNYVLRSYTNWMRNFSDAHFFFHRFTIASANENKWLVNTKVQSFNVNGNDSIRTTLQFSDLNKMPVANKPLGLKVITGKKTRYNASITTTQNGLAAVNFTLPGKPVQATLVAEDKTSSQKISIPLLLTRPGNIDVQFMPEGGELIAGLPAHIGFKAIGEDGRGVEINGIVVNSHNQQSAGFRTLHKGMGCFDILPVAGETYSARVSLPGGTEKIFALPMVKPLGISMQIHNRQGDDSLELLVSVTPGYLQGNDEFLLAGQSRNIVCYGASLKTIAGVIKSSVPKGLFPGGVAQFTLFSASGQPLNERLVFIDAKDSMGIKIATSDSAYHQRDSITVEITATDEDNLPLAGNFSLAVTDDDQVKNDVVYRQNIVSYTYLSSDLKGYIEDPGYYFQHSDSLSWLALDNLLLTQGWVGYTWQQVFNPLPAKYQPEREFMVKGKVLNGFNGAVSRTNVTLLSNKPGMLMDTTTGADGGFTFTHFPVLDTPQFIIQARNRHGKSFNVGIEIKEPDPPEFAMPPGVPELPWYINSDTTLLARLQDKRALDKKLFEGLTLQNVTVTAVKKVDDSQNLNGSGNADQVLDDALMKHSGKKTLYDLLLENVAGFHKGGGLVPFYYVKSKFVDLIIDGTNVFDFFRPPFSEEHEIPRYDLAYQYVKTYMDYFNAEEIKGIEVIYEPKYTTAYDNRFNPGSPPVWVYFEITTRSGKGPFMQITPGVYHYNGLPFSWPKKFYSPRYNVKDSSDHSLDLRSTVFWEPNIITDATGKASVSFCAADNPTTYTIIVEGTDFNGNVAVKTKKITITQKK